MNQQMGLRERKKERTRETIAATAIRLFLDRGFDQVSITEIAEAAEVSRRTLFAYFPTKEDLVLQRFADHENEAAWTVRARPAGQPPLEALRAAVLDGLARRDPNTGLCDDPEVMAFLRMIVQTESLAARMIRYAARGSDELAEALLEAGVDPLDARLVATQVIVVQRELAVMNQERLADGTSADDHYPEAVRAAERAFALLRDGLGQHG
ncbi:TetR family transcriptional regulator [Kitasatospora sp. NBC_01300]|uniref:TetR family transcriptional regulator n=1 Tax=Kitasatospora sp. NBC_01300 TaxID=2903574 RepID=UPI002F9138FB|nr:TetR/AcrR family transcriptional regulator [Kitasatospora sp. NBC_01300]